MAMKRQRRKRDRYEDRISKLPEFPIHQILSYVPPKEAARTTILSKTWLQSYSSSPFLSFDESFFSNSGQIVENSYPFFNFVNNTLLTYTRLNLRIHKLHITLYNVDHPPARLLDKSLGIAFDSGVKELHIATIMLSPYTLPSAMFDSPKLLTYLRVGRCKFPQNNSKCDKIIFPFLKTIHIYGAYIDDGMLQKLLSSSPFLENIVLPHVSGFNKLRVGNLDKLKALNIHSGNEIEIVIKYAPSLGLLRYWSLFKRPCLLKMGSSLQNLKYLELYSVSISDNSLMDPVTKSPILEDLRVDTCNELEHINILSGSLKHLYFLRCKMLVEARIDAPNLLKLMFNSKNMLSLSLNNTLDELKTNICINSYILDPLDNAWFNQLRKLLKGVNQARVSFNIWLESQGLKLDTAHVHRENPLSPEHETEYFMPQINHSSSLFAVFVETLFSNSCPTTIDAHVLLAYYVEFIKFLGNELMRAIRNPNCCSSDQTKCWRHYLKDIEVEVSEDSQEVW